MINPLRIDKSAYKIIYSKDDLENDVHYWSEKTEKERIEAIEFLRWQYIRMHHLPETINKLVYSIDPGK